MSHRLNRMTRTAIAVSLLTCFAAPAWADPSMEERLKEMEIRLDSMTSSKAAWAEKTSFGGYGEMHLNKLKNKKPGVAGKDEMDFHRFVLFMGHEFNERVRFFSELEVEHALVKDTDTDTDTATGPAPKTNPNSGELELEQAYLDFTLNDTLSAKAGLFLLPVGIINETHEPPVFYGVERNPVENKIIPATWWEGGGGVTARLGNGFTLDGAITGGLKTTAGKTYAVRDGRQKVASAVAKDAAYTARLKWAGIPGVELAGTVHRQADITQSADPTAGAAMLYEAHAVVNKGAFGLRALYAGWNLDGSGPKAVGADKQNGWYVEPAWKFSEQWGVFARKSNWDNQAGDAADSKYSQADVGVNYWPHPDVVVKLDFQNQQSPTGKDEFDGYNVGVGYQF